VSMTVVTDIVPFVLSSVVAAACGTTPAGSLIALLIIIVVGTVMAVIVMLARGFDRRRTLRAMPTDILYMETGRRGQQLLIVRGHAVPAVHLVSNRRKAVTK